MGKLGHYLLVGEVPQLLVPQSQDAGSFPRNLRVDVVIVGWALGELQETQRNVINYLTLTSPLKPRLCSTHHGMQGFRGPLHSRDVAEVCGAQLLIGGEHGHSL